MNSSSLPYVVCVGRPNVGKSTFFNRLAGRRMALVSKEPGMTRDRREVTVDWMGLSFNLVDTPGLFDPHDHSLSELMRQQTFKAVEAGDIILFLIDGKEGVTAYDHDIANILRRAQKPVILLINKTESDSKGLGIAEASRLGIGTHLIPISAEHGLGLSDLFDIIQNYVPTSTEDLPSLSSRPLKLAIMGRPNVGKSTLINTLLNEKRLLTADEPGVTRDSITISWTYNNQRIDLIDTAGLRKRGKISLGLEKLAAFDAERSLQYADVVVLVIDAHATEKELENVKDPFEKQDLTLAHQVLKEGRVLILALNKWDKVTKKPNYLKAFENSLEIHLSQGKGVTWVPISAQNNKNLDTLMNQVIKSYTLWNQRLKTPILNQWLQEQITKNPPPMSSGRRIRLKYITQTKTRPTTFVLFTTKLSELPGSYIRFLINGLRETFDLPGIPIRFQLKASKNPYVSK